MAKNKNYKTQKLEKISPFFYFFAQIHEPFWDTSIKFFLANIKIFLTTIYKKNSPQWKKKQKNYENHK